jgi:predicted alpha/beta hydrolase family esterase
MKNAIILHGSPEKKDYYDPELPSESNQDWLPWLQRQLQLKDIKADTPEVPLSFEPKLDLWTQEFERFDVGPETILVGHSCGGGFILRWLCENLDVEVDSVILVAPWLDPDRNVTTDFFEFKVDPQLPKRTKKLVIFHSNNDMPSIHKSVAIIREEIPEIGYREFNNYGHFGADSMKTTEFPELLQECLND